MHVLSLSLLFLLLFVAPVSAYDGDPIVSNDVYLSVSSFSWEEYTDGGERILREQGLLYGVGDRCVIDLFHHGVLLTLKGEVFGGGVDYDGQTQTDSGSAKTSNRPVETDVVYLGTTLAADLGWSAPLGALSVEPFVGVGYRWWLRDLKDSTALDTDNVSFEVSGYTEAWQMAYCRLGARGRYQTPLGISIFAEGGAKYPFHTANSVDFADGGVATFRPGAKWSGFAETGVSLRHLKLALFYDGLRISQSPQVLVGDKHFFQPRSSSDIFGVSLGWIF